MIHIEHLYKSYDSGLVVKDLNLHIEKGERVTIIGPSGCGKSTLLRLIMGLQRPDRGVIVVDGQDITSMEGNDLRQMRAKFGMLFQSGALFDSMTVAENVCFPLVENQGVKLDEVMDVVREKLDMVEMSGTEAAMPSSLSGGMKKRIGLARAIATDPEIVLYDEPTTGLDPILSTSIEDLIVKLNDKLHVTSLIVTHQISTILRTADKIYMMYDGALLPAETPATISKSKNEIIRTFISGGIKND